jgi:hypothetical protein
MKNSTDIWFISFLMLKGHKIEKYDVLSKGKVKCYFQLTEDEWQKYKLEFNNSEYIKFKALIEQVKDLGF